MKGGGGGAGLKRSLGSGIVHFHFRERLDELSLPPEEETGLFGCLGGKVTQQFTLRMAVFRRPDSSFDFH